MVAVFHPRRPAWWLIAAALVLAVAAWTLWRRPSGFLLEPSRDQNVLLVTIDTLRADALSSFSAIGA